MVDTDDVGLCEEETPFEDPSVDDGMLVEEMLSEEDNLVDDLVDDDIIVDGCLRVDVGVE